MAFAPYFSAKVLRNDETLRLKSGLSSEYWYLSKSLFLFHYKATEFGFCFVAVILVCFVARVGFGWTDTHHVHQAGLKCIPTSPSRVL